MMRTEGWTWRSIATAWLVAAAATAVPGAAARADELPPQLTQGAVSYMSGGIGGAEAAAMRREQAHYPLSLEFAQRAQPANEYLAGIVVNIADGHGRTVLSTISDGPLLLARLPDGRYRVTVDLNGRTKTQDVVVAADKPAHVAFLW